jgi:hypothetical protein
MSVRVYFVLVVLAVLLLPAYAVAQSGPQLVTLASATGDISARPSSLVSYLLDPNSDYTLPMVAANR